MLAAEVDGEIVLMSLARGNYYGLAGTARAIWDLLESPRQFNEICKLLAKKYASPEIIIAADVERFLMEMYRESVITYI